MARNKVQFQKGLSLTAFLNEYGTEEQCLAALEHWRWPNGFVCPKCGHDKACLLTTHRLRQCYGCRAQISVTAGTLFAKTKLPLTTWFLGIYLITQSKKGISGLELSRQLGISDNAAWRMKHKLMQAMMERDATKPLSGFVEIDDAFLGGERSGGKTGRGAPGKTPFIAAVQTTEGHQPCAIKLSCLKGFRSGEIQSWATASLLPGTTVISDGLACFTAVTKADCAHDRIVCGGGKASVREPEFYWVNTVLGNLKSALRSTYHSISPKHADRYLAEFVYRFNRRYDLGSMIARLAFIALRTLPMPEKLLRLA